MTYKLLLSSATLTLALGLAGCGDDKDTGGTGDTDPGAGTTGNTDDGPGMTNTGTPGTGDDAMTTGASMTSTPDTGDSVTATAGSDGPPDPLPDGASCTEDEQCESMQCYVAGLLGGVCGECNEDADCTEGGCSVPNPIAGTPSACNMGELGGGCETTDVCQEPLTCAVILDVPGVITASTCSDCSTDAECTDQLCVPTYNVSDISGYKTCEDAMSVADGLGCDLEGSGDMQCISGICAAADVMGFLELGVCSECELDDKGASIGCEGEQVCMPAAVDLAIGLIAGTCVDP